MKGKDSTTIDQHEGPDEDLQANFTPEQIEGIRQKVLEGIAEIERGEYTEYVGRAGLKQLTEDICRRGRERFLAIQNNNDGTRNHLK